jgi:selenium metabolism protein YedF
MVEERLDCRGLACPSPVLKTKAIIDRGEVGQLTVLVDNEAARENLSKFLSRAGYQVQVEEQEGVFSVIGSLPSQEACDLFVPEILPAAAKKILVLVGTDRLGQGDDELGAKLLGNFLGTLGEMGADLWRLVLLNGGVKLTVEGSEALPKLHELNRSGVSILVCGTCLQYFGLLEKKQVGETTNMLDIVTSLQMADKVISLT